jgi:hypothetical protein
VLQIAPENAEALKQQSIVVKQIRERDEALNAQTLERFIALRSVKETKIKQEPRVAGKAEEEGGCTVLDRLNAALAIRDNSSAKNNCIFLALNMIKYFKSGKIETASTHSSTKAYAVRGEITARKIKREDGKREEAYYAIKNVSISEPGVFKQLIDAATVGVFRESYPMCGGNVDISEGGP